MHAAVSKRAVFENCVIRFWKGCGGTRLEAAGFYEWSQRFVTEDGMCIV
jgi:hypothetical protein